MGSPAHKCPPYPLLPCRFPALPPGCPAPWPWRHRAGPGLFRISSAFTPVLEVASRNNSWASLIKVLISVLTVFKLFSSMAKLQDPKLKMKAAVSGRPSLRSTLHESYQSRKTLRQHLSNRNKIASYPGVQSVQCSISGKPCSNFSRASRKALRKPSSLPGGSKAFPAFAGASSDSGRPKPKDEPGARRAGLSFPHRGSAGCRARHIPAASPGFAA